MSDQDIYESRFKIGESVTIKAEVVGVQFTGSKVRYIFDIGPDLSIVNSDFVHPAGQLYFQNEVDATAIPSTQF